MKLPGRLLLACLAFVLAARVEAASPVWKVTSSQGGTLYLGGSIHALKKSDYPLPRVFDQALDSCDRLVFEMDENSGNMKRLRNSGEYPKGDSLKNHVDPRTYAYVRKVFSLLGMSEAEVSKYRPWALTLFLWSPALQGLSEDLGVEGHLTKRAKAKGKPISGLVSLDEHYRVFTGLSDKQSEGVLLLTFVPTTGAGPDLVGKWKRGQADEAWRQTRASFADYPAFGERLLEARNRAWMPKLESYLKTGKTYFVVVGLAHLGGPEGLLKLLKQRGYRLEQL